MPDEEHRLIFIISCQDAERGARFLQTGVCACGQYMEARSAKSRSEARKNLMRQFRIHQASKVGM